MAAKKPASIAVIEAAEASATRLDRWKSSLLRRDSAPSGSLDSFLSTELSAAAIVACMAELEGLIRGFLVSLAEQINGSRTRIRDLNPKLRSIAGHAHFESLATSEDKDNIWLRRLKVTSFESDYDIVMFPIASRGKPQPPLDGRTITPEHIHRIWVVLDLAADPFPDPACVASLRKLAGLRNDIAHCNYPIDEVFAGPGVSRDEIVGYLDDMVLFILHLSTVWSEYSLSRSYLLKQ